jgi:acetaldehyde dehydrogenase (acetylating)
MGQTASIHTRNRDAALRYGILMPAARVVVNTPSTHGAIGFSTGLTPSMTLGCGSWGGNVTSDNISPLHLMDIKRVAFETRPVTVIAEPPVQSLLAQSPHPNPSTMPQSDPGEAITAIVDRFISARRRTPEIKEPAKEIVKEPVKEPAPPVPPVPVDKIETNGHRAVDFVCEADVKQALASGEKIYVTAKTIITPAARELGEPREVFAVQR